MFAAPKTVNLPTDNPATPTSNSPNIDPLISSSLPINPIDETEEKNDPLVTQGTNNPSNEKLEQLSNEQEIDNVAMDKPSSVPPKNEVTQKKKTTTDMPESKETKGYIGFKVNSKIKEDLEELAKDFAYLARKQYGLKIKDDSSSILRAFLILGMSCFTEKVRHKTLQEYDPESTVEDEISQQLLAIMRIHKVEIDEIDF